MPMNDCRPREPALFTRHERILIVMAAMFIFGLTTSFVSSVGVFGEPEFGASKGSIVSAIFGFIRRWVPFAEELGAICFLLSIIVVAVTIFRTARREPWKVATAMAWSAGINLLFVCAYASRIPIDRGRHAFDLYYSILTYGLDRSPIGVLFSAGLFSVLIAGEFSCLVQERVMREELRVADAEGEEVVRRVSLRQQLVLAVLGPRMPVALAVRYALALLFIVQFGPYIIVKMVEAMGAGTEKSLPAPVIEKAGIREQSSQMEFRLTEEGKVFYKPSDGPLTQVDLERMLSIASTGPPAERRILLRVATTARYEHLIEIVAAAYRAGVPVVLEE